MYGIIPMANTVNRDKAPPEKHVEHVEEARLRGLEQLR